MPIQSSLPLTKKLLRTVKRKRIDDLAQSGWTTSSVLSTDHITAQTSRSAQVQAPHQDWKTILLYPGLVCYLSSAPLGRSHALHSASIFLERLLRLISFSKEKVNSTKMSGKMNKELMDADQTEVTLFMKENASQDWVRCCHLQVQAFFQ